MRTSRYIRVFAVLLLAVFVALAFSPAPAAGDELLIGLIPEENIFRAMVKYRMLAEYLSGELGIEVRFTILSRYGDIIERFISRDLDGAFFGIYTSALAIEQLGVEPIVRPLKLDGSTTARGYLFTTRDSGIETLADMRGARAAFVDRATATGYIFAIAHLRENGIEDPETYFSDVFFTGSHESTIYAVVDGRAEVGAAKGRILEKLSTRDPVIRDDVLILAESGELPDNTLCISSSVDPIVKRRLKEIFLKLDKDPRGAEVLKALGFRKFVDASAEDFSSVRSLAEKAGVGIRD